MGLRLSRPLFLLLVGIAFLGCGASAGATGAASTTTSTPSGLPSYAKNATVNIAVPRLPAEWNPLTPPGANTVTAMVMANVWPQVFVVGDKPTPGTCNEGGPLCPSVISSAQVASLSPLVVTYVVARGAKWSDGVPITSSDFIYEWQQELTVGPTLPASNPTLGYEDIASISPPDATTFNVTFSTPYADWSALFSPLVPAHVAAAGGWQRAFDVAAPGGRARTTTRAFPLSLVSGGPYELQSETYNGNTPVALTLVRNPHYWGTPAHLVRLVFRVEPSEGATLKALAANTVQLATLPPGPAVDSLVAGNPALSESISPSPTIEQLVFNLADPTLVPALRQAIAAVIDRHQLFTNTIGLTTEEGNVAVNRLFLVGGNGAQSNDSQYETVDIDSADGLLASAGYKLDPDGTVLNADGAPLTLHLAGPTADPVVQSVEEQLQAQFLQLGIRLVVDNVPEKQLLGTVLPLGHYQLALAPYLLSPYLSTEAALYTNPIGPTPPSTSTGIGASSVHQVSKRAPATSEAGAVVSGSVTRDIDGFSDSKITNLFSEAAGELNETAGVSLYNEIDTALWLDMPTLPLFDQPVALVGRADLVGVTMAPTLTGPLWDAQNWAIQTNPSPTTTTTLAPGG